MSPCFVILSAIVVSTAEPAPVAPHCTCAAARLKGGWCSACKVGHLASVRIPSELLFEVLDAHGHTIDLSALSCTYCRKARSSGGYCNACRMGWIDGKAYLSRLTYHLTRGRPVAAAQVKCQTCKANAARYGWCDTCKVGMLGNVAVTDKGDYEHGAKAVQRLLQAVRLLGKCETCAVALMSDGICMKCKAAFKNGERTAPLKPHLPRDAG